MTNPLKVFPSLIQKAAKASQQTTLSIKSSSELSVHISYINSQIKDNTTTLKDLVAATNGKVIQSSALARLNKNTNPVSSPTHGAVSQSSVLVLLNKHANPIVSAALPVDKPHLLNLPLEIRYNIYEILIDSLRIMCLSYHKIEDRRIGILEPLLHTNKHLRTEVIKWALGHTRVLRSPLWGLFNPYQSQVCVRYRDPKGHYTSIFIGMPLLQEKCDRITKLWRGMRMAKTDFYVLVNQNVTSDISYDTYEACYCNGVQVNENRLLDTVEKYRLKPTGDYVGVPLQLPL